MSQFVYFQAGGSLPLELPPEILAVLPTARQWGEGRGGPDSTPGLLVAAGADQAALTHPPEALEWQEHDAAGWHVGCLRGGPPTPAELLRPDHVPGELVRLACGREWLVPRLRVYVGSGGFQTALPRRMVRRGGTWRPGPTLPHYAAADQLASELLDTLLVADVSDGVGAKLPYPTAADLVCRLLAINYHVGPSELSLLGSIAADQSLGRVLAVASDFAAVEADLLGKLQALAE